MRFEELLKEAMEEDVEVCKAVQKHYRGSFGECISSRMYGERFVLFTCGASHFENAIRSEIDAFIGGKRILLSPRLVLIPEFTFVFTPNAVDGDCNYMLRVAEEDDYSYYCGEMTFGRILVPKKELVKVLKERGWM